MKKYILFFLLAAAGCKPAPKSTVIRLTLVDNGRSVKFTGLDNDIIQELNRDSSTANWQNLLPVYRMPADTDVKDYQPVQPGKYTVKDSSVIFTPDTPFARQQTYFVRFYKYGEGNNAIDYINQSKKLGKPRYVDLIFKQ